MLWGINWGGLCSHKTGDLSRQIKMNETNVGEYSHLPFLICMFYKVGGLCRRFYCNWNHPTPTNRAYLSGFKLELSVYERD